MFLESIENQFSVTALFDYFRKVEVSLTLQVVFNRDAVPMVRWRERLSEFGYDVSSFMYLRTGLLHIHRIANSSYRTACSLRWL